MIVKILFVNDAAPLEKYLKEKQGPGNPLTVHDTTLNGMTEDFRRSQRVCKQKGNEAIHIIQSWSPQESAKLTPDEVHKMGETLVKRFAPGHAFVLETHTDEDHAHNHIVVNPVNPETKKRIMNKKVHLQTLRDLNDTIAKENGLTVLPPQLPGRRDGASEKVRRIDAYRGQSFILDLADKANFARSHATNFDEYGAILSAFDIQVRVEDKNITYFYPGKNHGKRGKTLDPRLDKPSLEKQFIENQVALISNPDARISLTEWVRDYEASRKIPERPSRGKVSASVDHATLEARFKGIPETELSRAKTHDIIDYCKRTGIELLARDEGGFALKGRDYVHVGEHSWINTKNKTRGTIVDFVAIHKGVSYLEAVAAVNQNPRLLALRETLHASDRSYQSFYIPKGESASRDESLSHLSRLLGHPKRHPVYAELFKRQQVWVGKDGTVAFLAHSGRAGAVEYRFQERSEPEVTWLQEGKPFLMRRGRSDRLVLFTDPRNMLMAHPDLFIGAASLKDSTLVLTSPDTAPVVPS